MKISQNIYWYHGGPYFCNSYLIVNNFGILIDPGTTLRNHQKRILQELKKDGLSPDQIKQIWLTHSHPDHSQSVKAWTKNSSIKTLAHPEAQKILENRNPMVALINRESKAAGEYKKDLISSFDISIILLVSDFIYGRWEKTKIDDIFKENQIINHGDLEIQVLFPKAHSPDDVCFWLPKEKILISGDLFDTKRGNPESPVLIFPSADLNNCIRTLEQFILLEPKILCPGHGEILIGQKEILNYFRKILSRAEEYKKRALEILEKKPSASFYEIGRYLETRKNLSATYFSAHSTLSFLGFVVMKALKEDGLII